MSAAWNQWKAHMAGSNLLQKYIWPKLFAFNYKKYLVFTFRVSTSTIWCVFVIFLNYSWLNQLDDNDSPSQYGFGWDFPIFGEPTCCIWSGLKLPDSVICKENSKCNSCTLYKCLFAEYQHPMYDVVHLIGSIIPTVKVQVNMLLLFTEFQHPM